MNDSIADPLADWRQGDFVCGSHGFVCLGSDGKTVGAKTIGIDTLGYVLISQLCDIVRRTSGRDFVAVCPLIQIEEEKSKAAKKGRLPYMISVESAGAFVYADLRRVMSVEKDVLATWQRNVSFSTEKDRLKFAAALERKFGQFAFPDEFDAIEWPEGYEWNDPRLLLQTARDLTGEDSISTQRADFDFLSY